jgi:hypothetical protein
MDWMMLLLAVAILAACGWGAMRVAEQKGLDGFIWAIIGFVMGPIGVLLAMGMPRR